MTVRGITITIDCADLAACREFYVGVVGLTPLRGLERQEPAQRRIALGWPDSPGDGQVWLRAKDPARSGGEFAQHAVALSIEVMDVDRVYHAARSAGHPITESLHDSAGDRRFTVTDPQGTSVDVYTRVAGATLQDSPAWAVLAEQTDLRWPYAVRVAATLRLADLIAAGATGIDELSTQTDADPGALGRLLRYLACRGVFRGAGPGRFVMTGMAELLRDEHPSRLRAWLDLEGAGGRMDQAVQRPARRGQDGRARLPRHVRARPVGGSGLLARAGRLF
jgi:catechol 2,3-dioxygenase-like lactoylglutathione lyase family enzyme